MKMGKLSADYCKEVKLGIIGCGHLGQALLESLIVHGFSRENIFISYRGNPATYDKINKLGFADRIAETEKILQETDIIFLTLKPQDVGLLKSMTVSEEALVVSCVAGLSARVLKSIWDRPVLRMMVSGPDTILSQRGMAALYPYDEAVGGLLREMRFSLAAVADESEMDIFTAGVCLPAALSMGNSELAIQAAITAIAREYPAFFDLYAWARGVLPAFRDAGEREEYISRMITKGGVTEAIVTSLKAGEPFLTALTKGIALSRDISREVGASIVKETDLYYLKEAGIVEKFDPVSVVKEANIYFDGKVTSRTILLAGGERKTLGIMLPGEYEFGTSDREHMELLAGKLEVLLPGSDEWLSVGAGQTFDIPAQSKFKVIVKEVADYCCSYFKE